VPTSTAAAASGDLAHQDATESFTPRLATLCCSSLMSIEQFQQGKVIDDDEPEVATPDASSS
jgi:hypothetical protein